MGPTVGSRGVGGDGMAGGMGGPAVKDWKTVQITPFQELWKRLLEHLTVAVVEGARAPRWFLEAWMNRKWLRHFPSLFPACLITELLGCSLAEYSITLDFLCPSPYRCFLQ